MAFSAQARNATLSEMNITPLVDVMLVLLIIFMVATPMLSRALPLDLPIGDKTPPPPPSQTVTLRIEADGSLRWNDALVSSAAVDALFKMEAVRDELPLLEIAVSPEADYRHMAHWLGRARAAGFDKIAMP